MRMWNVDPKLLCRQHILGEHLEMHYFIGTIKKNKKLDGYINNGLVEVHNILTRHDELEIEMKSRGINAKSPLTYDNDLPKIGFVNVQENLQELCRRCSECRSRIQSYELR